MNAIPRHADSTAAMRQLQASLDATIGAVAALPWSLFPEADDPAPLGQGSTPFAVASDRVINDPKRARAVERAARPFIRTAERAMQAYLRPYPIQWHQLGNRLTWWRSAARPQIELAGAVRIRPAGVQPWPRHDITFCLTLACLFRSLAAAERLRAAAEALSLPEPDR